MSLVDTDTNEHYDRIFVRNGARFPTSVVFMYVFQEMWSHARAWKLTRVELDVLTLLLERMEYGNVVHISQAGIAELLDMYPSDVTRIIQKLAAADFIDKVPDPQDHRRLAYQLNPLFVWMGTVKEWSVAVKSKSKHTPHLRPKPVRVRRQVTEELVA